MLKVTNQGMFISDCLSSIVYRTNPDQDLLRISLPRYEQIWDNERAIAQGVADYMDQQVPSGKTEKALEAFLRIFG